MDYFTQIPLVRYPSIEDSGNTSLLLTNIMTRSAFLRDITENSALFYEYQVKDAETPEIIADKLYGDPKRFWIVMLFNSLGNPFYDFPLTQDQLNEFIENKYSISLATAQSTIHHYEEIVNRSVLFNGIVQTTEENIYTISAQVQDDGVVIARPSLPNTADTTIVASTEIQTFDSGITVSTVTSLRAVSIYNYEFEENEKRRSIRLLDAQYVVNVENEFRRLMRDGN